MEQPPLIQAESSPQQKVGLGRVGLYVSLAAIGALAVLMLAKPG
jgi:hypothetical protein